MSGESRKKGRLYWDVLRLRPGLLERLNAEAQMRGLIPAKVERGQDPVKIGVEILVEQLISEVEKKRKRKEGKE